MLSRKVKDKKVKINFDKALSDILRRESHAVASSW